jgi:HTH-type transcriptional regulator, sugar sensing transcriptional regulator
VKKSITDSLHDLGFSLYEARVYLALLQNGSQNGNEVAKHASVPSSKVYAALDKLASEGFVQSSQRGASRRWAALPPDELLSRLRKHYNDPLDFLGEQLPKIQATEAPDPFFTVAGMTAAQDAALSLIGTATAEIHISCWEMDLEALRTPLQEAHDHNVRIFGMLYGNAEPPAGSWLHHHYVDIVGNRIAGRLLALVADEREALIARIPDNGEVAAVRSRNPVMTLIVKEYLHHDSVLQRAQLQIGFDEWDRWWKADPDARAEILGQAIAVEGD